MCSGQENWGAGTALLKWAAHAEVSMTRKHLKGSKPSDADLYRNPMIGGSKGAAMAQVTADDMEEFAGENTIEGDIENDTNPQGGIDKAEVNDRRGPPRKDRASGSNAALQGRKTHEQQLRMLEGKPDFPDQRQLDSELARAPAGSARSPTHLEARQSEFPVSRGGLNQESQHNKHNHENQRGHKPQKQ
jgi:hypothetical protein